MNTVRLVIGDWSNGGHNQSDDYFFECSNSDEEIKNAYFKFVKKHKISLHDEGLSKLSKMTVLCCNYKDSYVLKETVDKLKEIGIDLNDENKFDDGCTGDNGDADLGPKDIAILFMEMVKVELPGFQYEFKEKQKTLNGFWSDDFNFSFGYGCYH